MPVLLNVGSLNIDWVYRVNHIARPGETIASLGRERFAGGKGANQSVAAARAGQCVAHIGRVGRDGQWLRELLANEGIDVASTLVDSGIPTGHAVIQVGEDGENAILLFPGANHAISETDIEAGLKNAKPGDWVLTQNETHNAAAVVAAASRRKLPLVLNPAPMTADVPELGLENVDVLIVNEVEARAMAGEADAAAQAARLGERVRRAAVVTLGARGVVAAQGGRLLTVPAHQVPQVVDTTAAGDAFVGYLVASLMRHDDLETALRRAAAAAALTVATRGAIPSIPRREQAESLLNA